MNENEKLKIIIEGHYRELGEKIELLKSEVKHFSNSIQNTE
jgi:hypothetical protein